MEKVNLGCSIKKISIPSRKGYLLQLLEKIEMLIKRMRWKEIHFIDDEDNNKKRNGIGKNH